MRHKLLGIKPQTNELTVLFLKESGPPGLTLLISLVGVTVSLFPLFLWMNCQWHCQSQRVFFFLPQVIIHTSFEIELYNLYYDNPPDLIACYQVLPVPPKQMKFRITAISILISFFCLFFPLAFMCIYPRSRRKFTFWLSLSYPFYLLSNFISKLYSSLYSTPHLPFWGWEPYGLLLTSLWRSKLLV